MAHFIPGYSFICCSLANEWIETAQLKKCVSIKIQNILLFEMIRIEYPTYTPVTKKESGREMIFDPIRKRWVSLTPEEWVRQNFLEYITKVLNYPASLIAVEKKLVLGDLMKRFDIVVYKNSQPFMIIECKEMNVRLTEKVLHQVLRYNTNIQAPFLVVTNGTYCYAFEKISDCFNEIEKLPEFK